MSETQWTSPAGGTDEFVLVPWELSDVADTQAPELISELLNQA